jgi:hypothetical protein
MPNGLYKKNLVNLCVFESLWQKIKIYLIIKELSVTKSPRHEETQSYVTFKTDYYERITHKFNSFNCAPLV